MASGAGDDPDLESLRSAVLASLKTKPNDVNDNAGDTESPAGKDEKDGTNGPDEDGENEEEEEDLDALRLAALKTKREDGAPKDTKPAATFERKGNLISIQIVDPEEEKRKAAEEKLAKAKAEAACKAEAGKAAKPTRFKRVESDSEDDQDGSSESESSDDDRSASRSSRSLSMSSSSSSSSSSAKSSSESSSSSSSSSESEHVSESGSDSDSRERKEKSSPKVTPKGARKENSRRNSTSVERKHDRGQKDRRKSSETRDKSRSERGDARRSVKDRLGKRLPERRRSRDRKSPEKDRPSRRNSREERRRDERPSERRPGRGVRSPRRRETPDTRNDIRSRREGIETGANGTARERTVRRPDIRERLEQISKLAPGKEPLGSTGGREHSRDRPEPRRSPVRSRSTEVTGSRQRPDRIHERVVNGPSRKEPMSARIQVSKNSPIRNDPAAEQNSRGHRDVSKNVRTLHSRKATDSDSLSDIPLESEEEEKGRSDDEDVRFRKGRHEDPKKGGGIESGEAAGDPQSRLVMSLTLPTDSELKKADEEQQKDFKRRRDMNEERNRVGADPLRDRRSRRSGSLNTRRTGKIDLRSRNRDGPPPRNRFSSPENSREERRPRDGEKPVRRKPKPSDFVSESDSEAEPTGAGLRSQVSGSGDAEKLKEESLKKLQNRTKESDTQRMREGSGEEDRRDQKRDKRGGRGRRKRRARRETPDDKENGEAIIQKLSIRDRLGSPPTRGTLGPSIKSRLGPKVSSPDLTEEPQRPEIPEEPQRPEIPEGPKKRRIEVMYEESNPLDGGDVIGRFEGGSDIDDKDMASSKLEELIEPNDLRRRMKRRPKHKDKESVDQLVVGVSRQFGEDSDIDDDRASSNGKVQTKPEDLRHKMKSRQKNKDGDKVEQLGGDAPGSPGEESDIEDENRASSDKNVGTKPDDLRHKMKSRRKNKDGERVEQLGGDASGRPGEESDMDAEDKASNDRKVQTKPDDLRLKMKRKLKRKDKERGEGDRKKKVKRKIVRKKDWQEISEERTDKKVSVRSKLRERSESPPGIRSREKPRKRGGSKQESKSKDDELLEAKMKRMQEMNRAIMERHKRVQKEKEMFDF